METVIDRLAAFIESKNISDREFQRVVGGSSGQMNAAKRSNRAYKDGKRDNPASLTSIFIENIMHAYPELDANWLLTGKGSMLIDATETESNISHGGRDMDILRKECYTKANKIIALMEENAIINKELLKARKELDELRDNVGG